MASNSPATPVEAARIEALANGRYHADREAHLDTVHNLLIALVIILGASALGDLFPAWGKAAAGAATVIAGTLDLVLKLVERARAHAVLREKYFEIDARLQATGASAASAKQAMSALAGKEEPPFMAAHAVAEVWATMSVLGSAAAPCCIPPRRRFLRHWLRQNGADFSAGSGQEDLPLWPVGAALGVASLAGGAAYLLPMAGP
jgi:hypothetical protein